MADWRHVYMHVKPDIALRQLDPCRGCVMDAPLRGETLRTDQWRVVGAGVLSRGAVSIVSEHSSTLVGSVKESKCSYGSF
jgi:hypothetical protein